MSATKTTGVVQNRRPGFDSRLERKYKHSVEHSGGGTAYKSGALQTIHIVGVPLRTILSNIVLMQGIEDLKLSPFGYGWLCSQAASYLSTFRTHGG